jgi:hypothetical protein
VTPFLTEELEGILTVSEVGADLSPMMVSKWEGLQKIGQHDADLRAELKLQEA